MPSAHPTQQPAVAREPARLQLAVGLGARGANAEPLAAVELQVAADVGVERPHRQLELARRPGRVQAALLRGRSCRA